MGPSDHMAPIGGKTGTLLVRLGAAVLGFGLPSSCSIEPAVSACPMFQC